MKDTLKIAILGTRGIPNNHGGFEQFAEYFSVYMADKGHMVYVYNSHDHPYQKKSFNGVNIIHCYDPEYNAQEKYHCHQYGWFGMETHKIQTCRAQIV